MNQRVSEEPAYTRPYVGNAARPFTLRPPAAERPHVALRPSWRCKVDGEPWPCPTSRMLLGIQFRGDRAGLSVYMAGYLYDCTADLARLNPNPGPDPKDLFDRFFGWIPRKGPLGPDDPALNETPPEGRQE